MLSYGDNISDNFNDGQQITDLSILKSVKKTAKISNFLLLSNNDKYHQLFLQPVKNNQNQTLGILLIDVNLDYINKILNNNFQLGNSGKIYLSTLDKVRINRRNQNKGEEVKNDGINRALEESGLVFGKFKNNILLHIAFLSSTVIVDIRPVFE